MLRANDSRDLVRQLKHGEKGATDRLVALYRARLLVAALRLCRNETDAQDLTAETLQAAVSAIGSFREGASFFSWLYGILLNLHRMSVRKRDRARVVYVERLPSVAAMERAVGHALDGEALADCLAGAIGKLAKVHQDVVLLRYYGELKIADIAAVLALKPGTVKSRLFNALRQLKNILPREMNYFG